MTLEALEHLTTATATAADPHHLAGIARLEYETGFVGPAENLQRLFKVDGAADVVSRVILGRAAEREAAFLGLVTAATGNSLFATADAGRYNKF